MKNAEKDVMLSETLASGLERYKIGSKIRALRLDKKLGLVQLGEHTGLSAAMLSKIERGKLFPTLPTLLRIALVFSVGLEHFFVERAERPLVAVVRGKDRLRLPDRPGNDPPGYFFESLDFPVTDGRMRGFYAEFPKQSTPSEPHQHEGAELIYTLKGQLVVNVDGEDVVLGQGDALYFDSGARHSYRRHGPAACAVIIVVAA